MNKRLFWKLCLIIAIGVVVLFWIIDIASSLTEKSMSFINAEYRQQITEWGVEAEHLYLANDKDALNSWLLKLKETEQTWVAIAKKNLEHLAGDSLGKNYYEGYNLGRNVNWQIHLYFKENPIIEIPFSSKQISFLIKLPERMRPGYYLDYTWITLKVILPMTLLALLSITLYRHIMTPLKQLESATRSFTDGNFDVRVRQLLGKRNDELSHLADTFDQMAARIGEQIISQRQLISDLSHELRTPLTRLDISIQSLKNGQNTKLNLKRIERESKHIRKLVEDSLTLAWLENSRPKLQQESLDLADLMDVLIDDALFEFPDRKIDSALPKNAKIYNSNHRSLAHALENIIRNALRFTPPKKNVSISINDDKDYYHISVCDQGSGVPEKYLTTIFQPFFRVDTSGSGFGLGLALAQRQVTAVGGKIIAKNIPNSGLEIKIYLPKA